MSKTGNVEIASRLVTVTHSLFFNIVPLIMEITRGDHEWPKSVSIRFLFFVAIQPTRFCIMSTIPITSGCCFISIPDVIGIVHNFTK
jgi:hypothetical protein